MTDSVTPVPADSPLAAVEFSPLAVVFRQDPEAAPPQWVDPDAPKGWRPDGTATGDPRPWVITPAMLRGIVAEIAERRAAECTRAHERPAEPHMLGRFIPVEDAFAAGADITRLLWVLRTLGWTS
ncbi:MAG: hypothetical protein AB7G65_19310 [Thermoleophilia bacterium]